MNALPRISSVSGLISACDVTSGYWECALSGGRALNHFCVIYLVPLEDDGCYRSSYIPSSVCLSMYLGKVFYGNKQRAINSESYNCFNTMFTGCRYEKVPSNFILLATPRILQIRCLCGLLKTECSLILISVRS